MFDAIDVITLFHAKACRYDDNLSSRIYER